MRSMFYKLFGGIVFVTMLLGNIVMANDIYLNDKLYDVLNYVYKCNDINPYSDECLTRSVDKLQSQSLQDTIDELSDIYYEYTGDVLILEDWILTVTAYTQDRRYKNKEYNDRNGIFSEYVATQHNLLEPISKSTAKNDTLCQNLILYIVVNDSSLRNLLKEVTLSEEKEERLMKITSYLISGCTVKHDKFSNLKFPVKWNDRQLKEYIDEYYKLLAEIDQGL